MVILGGQHRCLPGSERRSSRKAGGYCILSVYAVSESLEIVSYGTRSKKVPAKAQSLVSRFESA